MSARFAIPNFCVGLIQFLFDVLISVYFLCLLGIDKFNVLLTCIVIYPYNKNQQDALFTFNLFH